MSKYQEIYFKHLAGDPPGADPQRATETFEQYQARMNALGLQPDITQSLGEFEEDADYEARIATYAFPRPASQPIKDKIYAENIVGTISASYAEYAELAGELVEEDNGENGSEE